jgi:hypothetical protein
MRCARPRFAGKRDWSQWMTQAEAIDVAVGHTYGRGAPVAASFLLSLLGWLVGTGEVYFILQGWLSSAGFTRIVVSAAFLPCQRCRRVIFPRDHPEGFNARHHSRQLPKCLLQFGGMSLLERHLRLLKCAGVDEIVLALGESVGRVGVRLCRAQFQPLQGAHE